MMVGLSLAVIITVSYLFYYQNNVQYEENIQIAKKDLLHITRAVSSHVNLTFLATDKILRRAAERRYFNELFGKNLKDDLQHNLKMWVNETPHLEGMVITDAQGNAEVSYYKEFSTIWTRPQTDSFVDQEHFNKHKSQEYKDIVISALRYEGEPDHHMVMASHRLTNIDGSFGGLVIAIMDGYYLTDFFQSVESENDIKLALILDRSSFLVNGSGLEPDSEKVFAAMYDPTKDTELDMSISILQSQSNEDGVNLYSFGLLDNLPITVSVTMHDSYILKMWYEDRSRYLTFLGIFIGFIAVVILFSLILARKMRQVQNSEKAALMASQAKSDFLAKMSHELRTPLNAIIGFSDMLSSGYFGKVNHTQMERLQDIHMCGNHLLEFISDILEFSKGDVGKICLDESSFDLSLIINRAIRMIRQRAESEGINIINKSSRQSSNIIYADARKIQQILINLLSNSVKFTKSGGEISVSADIDKKGDLVISVSDTGLGIAKDDIAIAMSVFGQVHHSGKYEGTGLGLPLCKMFAELHGGSFKLDSEVDKGTNVTIIIPKNRIVNFNASHKEHEHVVTVV
ncbi:ATP-binding protein [Rickettsiales bacterium]|nr:ATP-binding protein [Rickettsiales bacterium]